MRFAHLLRGTIATIGVVFALASTADAARHHRGLEHCSRLSARRGLVCAHRALRARRGEEHWITARKSRTLFALNTRSYWRAHLAFLAWRVRVDRRTISIDSRRLRTTVARPLRAGHVALWLCIHSREGAWHDATGNGYFGGLQMTAGWGGVARPDLLSPAAQMSLAERQYRASGYSHTWLVGQWPNTAPPCLGYA